MRYFFGAVRAKRDYARGSGASAVLCEHGVVHSVDGGFA